MRHRNTLDISEIYNLLYQLGITANYTGFFHTAYAVYLAAQQPDRLALVTKWLYPEVAKRCSTTWTAVERNIRTAIAVSWRCSPDYLEGLARRPITKKPTGAQFLSILSNELIARQTLKTIDTSLKIEK